MLRIPEDKHRTKVVKDFGHQFVLLAEKIGNGYQTFVNLVKSTQKSTCMARNTITGIIASLQPNITTNKRKSKNRASIFKKLEKDYGRAYYEQFYQIDKVIGSDKFFQQFGAVLRQYQSPCKIIVIWAVNNFTIYKILTTHVRISSNNYRYQTINDFEKLLAKEDNENTAIITAPILISIYMHIGPSGFLKDGVLEVVYDINQRIYERLVIVF